MEILKPVLEDPSVIKVLQNAKYDAKILSRYDIDIAPIDPQVERAGADDGLEIARHHRRFDLFALLQPDSTDDEREHHASRRVFS